MSGAGALMDRIYVHQRHIYDATRKFYLLGRDDLIAGLAPPPGGSVLEIGCGTARNLIAVARRYPGVACHGIDISQAMLATAQRSVDRAGLHKRIRLAEGDASCFDSDVLFGIKQFDRVMISYALSMIPGWQEVLRHAAGAVTPGGALHVVDFGSQAGLPPGFKRLLHTWLSRFHVSPRADLPQEIGRLAEDLGMRASVRELFRGYAVSGELQRARASAI